MSQGKKLDVWLKTGLAVNALYSALMLFFFMAAYFSYRSAGEYGTWAAINDTMLRYTGFLMMSDYVVMMRPLYWLLFNGQNLFIFVLLAFFAMMIVGVYLTATRARQRKTGAILALVGSAGFFPLGILGAVGAWHQLKKSGGAESSVSNAEAGNALPPVAKLFTQSWALYTNRFKTLLGTMLLTTGIALAVLVLSAITDRHSIQVLVSVLSLDIPSISGNLDHVLPMLPFYLALLMIVFWGTAAMMVAASAPQLSMRQSLGQAWKKLRQIVWLTVLTMFLVIGGYGLFVLPGVLLAVWVMFGLYAVIAEDAHGMNGLAISREYVRGRWWPVFLRFLLVWLIPASFLIMASTVVASARSEGSILFVFGCIVIFQILFTPFFLVYLYRLYLDLKETKKEPHAQDTLRKTESVLLRIGAAGWGTAVILAILVFITSTTLSEASYRGRTWLVTMKLKAGVSGEQIQDAFGRAIEGGQVDIVRVLLDHGAGVNEKSYRTPLMMAGSNPEIVKLLIERGADVNAQDDEGYTALMNANAAVARTLIERGADVNAANQEGTTALINAVKGSNYSDPGAGELISLLLEHGAKVNAKDKIGNTALLYGLDLVLKSSYGSDRTIEIINNLVSRGADVNVKNDEGVTPLMLVQYAENQADAEKLKAILKKAGARR
jgi:hypothetical protein